MVMSADKKQFIHYVGSSSEIVIPKSVECIGKSCFYWCKSLRKVIFESGSNLKLPG
jgi:hypothetical protein